ncbi:MAG: PAS domain S-box protein [bacterium]|nr:PAS domain S-box protein [bacterium]
MAKSEIAYHPAATETEPLPQIFRQSFLDSSDAIMITDRQGVIVDVNPAFSKIYGYPRDEILGKTPRALRSPFSAPELYLQMWKEILDPEIGYWKGEITNRCKNGKLVPVLLSITPIRDIMGETTHYMGLAINISEKRTLEAKVERLRREYGAFLRHEMRNMLAAIIGYIELALNFAEPVPPRLKKYLDSAQNSTLSSLKVIDMLRELDYYEMGRTKLDKQFCSLNNLLQNAIKHLRPLAQESGIEIVIAQELPRDEVNVDLTKMELVFINLIKNAIEHVARIPGEAVRVRIYEDFGWPAVSINNHGTPIPPERLAGFFERFNTTKKEHGGTGLGTTFAELITRAHGGEIRVSSSPIDGTTVTLRFPQILDQQLKQADRYSNDDRGYHEKC